MNKVLVVGDAIIDKYIYGSVSRISPEAPVPVVKFKEKRFQPGGALNVAKCLTTLGCDVNIVCQDFSSKYKLRVYDFCNTMFTVDSNCPVKTRVIGNNQQICRIDEETCEHNFSSARYNFENALDRYGYDVVVISDYGKGLFSKRFASFVNNTLTTRGIPFVVDSKVKEHYPYWAGAEWVCPNVKEALEILAGGEGGRSLTESMLKKFNVKRACITDGENGAYFANSQIDFGWEKAGTVEVVDVTGAGDVVVAVLGYLSQIQFAYLHDSLKVSIACRLASESVKHHGCYCPKITYDECENSEQKMI